MRGAAAGDAVAGTGGLARESPLPLIADDSAFTLPELERELAHDSFDILNIKTARNGFSEAQAMEAAALAQGRGVMVGSQAGSMIGCLHALLFGAREGVATRWRGSFFLRVEDDYAICYTLRMAQYPWRNWNRRCRRSRTICCVNWTAPAGVDGSGRRVHCAAAELV